MIAIANWGKTTTNRDIGLAQEGKKVLPVDAFVPCNRMQANMNQRFAHVLIFV